MKNKRKIIEIDEEKCNGCGQCILACAEGALELVDGKAKLVGELFCDGLGACIGDCPQDALKIIEREADDFDEQAATERMATTETQSKPEPAKPFVRPSAVASRLTPGGKSAPVAADAGLTESELGHWPVKLQLLSPTAPFLKDAELLLLADCVAVAHPNLHRKLLRNRAVAIACPKFDDPEAHIERLAALLREAPVRSLTVAHMEVPCCHGLERIARRALQQAGVDVPARRIIISRAGEVMTEQTVEVPKKEKG